MDVTLAKELLVISADPELTSKYHQANPNSRCYLHMERCTAVLMVSVIQHISSTSQRDTDLMWWMLCTTSLE